MGIYQSGRGFGKRALFAGLMIAAFSGCGQMRERDPVLIDVNRDGTKDKVYWSSSKNDIMQPTQDVYVQLNRGDHTETRKVLHLEDVPFYFNVEDMDGDQISDISYKIEEMEFLPDTYPQKFLSSTRRRYFSKGNGDGTFQDPTISTEEYETVPQ